MSRLSAVIAMLCGVTLGACSGGGSNSGSNGVESDIGVDVDNRILYVGALNDESGPGAVVGRPYAAGPRMLAAQINAGGSGILPEGWTVELIERDHGYNPQRSVQSYNEIRDRVLFFATSFGTPNTLPLRPMLERDNVVAFPASLSSLMAEFELTPMPLASYKVEAMRAMDWAVEQAGGPGNVNAGIVYQQDDYGQDGLEGWRAAAEHHGVTIVSEQATAPGQSDYTAVVSTLRSQGANYVMLTVLPSTTGPLLGTAAQLSYEPTWVGNTPAWVDAFFDPEVIPPVVFDNYHMVSSTPYWGEDVPGMQRFLDTYEQHGRELHSPDWYTLLGYLQSLAGIEAFRRALDMGDVTREGYLKALHSIDAFDGLGLFTHPVSMVDVPYEAMTTVRVLRPVMADRSWTVESDYQTPAVLGGGSH